MFSLPYRSQEDFVLSRMPPHAQPRTSTQLRKGREKGGERSCEQTHKCQEERVSFFTRFNKLVLCLFYTFISTPKKTSAPHVPYSYLVCC